MRAKIRFTVLSVAFAAFGIAILTPEIARARPGYKDIFEKTYSGKLEKVDCAVCHTLKNGKVNKKERNEYGQAVGKALAAKNVDDDAKIEAALKKAGKEKGKAGKAFGDLIEDGKRPAS